MKKIILFCDGGLGNRLGVLVGGLLIANELNREPIVCWPENTWCGCSFKDLYVPNFDLIDLDINTLFTQNQERKFLIHENQTNLTLHTHYPNRDNIEFFKTLEDDTVIYYHNAIPEFYSEEQILSTLDSLKVKQEIRDRVNTFCTHKKINTATLGIHFRKTDFQVFLDEDEVYRQIEANSQTSFFICSDSLETENKFRSLLNVYVYPKKEYVKKFQEGSWNDLIVDNEGRQMTFNISRSKESVIEGFIDLLILSRTTILVESHSSFLRFSKLYSKIDI